MQDSKFLSLFRSLEPEEVPAFYKYLKQQHGGDTKALKIFEYVRKHHPTLDGDKRLELSEAYEVLFGIKLPPNGPVRKKALNVLSDLSAYLKDFLLCEKVRRDDDFESQALWLSILQERNLKAEFSRQALVFHTSMKDTFPKSIKEHLGNLVADYFHHHRLALSGALADVDVLQQYLETLAVCNETIWLKVQCELITRHRIDPPEPNTEPSIETFGLHKAKAAQNVPLLLLYREIYQLLVTKQEIHFDRVGDLITEYADLLDPIELHETIKYMYNYAAGLARKGDEIRVAQKFHAFNKFAERHGFFEQSGTMTPTGFNNIVNIACSLEDFTWVSAFVDKHRHYFPEDTILLAEAGILFEQKKFDGVLNLLESSPFRDANDTIRAMLLILRSYYSLGQDKDADRVLYYCNNFDAWLRRHQARKPDQVGGARSFLRLFKQLLLNKTDKKALLTEIRTTPVLFCRTWLEKQALGYKGTYATSKRRKQ